MEDIRLRHPLQVVLEGIIIITNLILVTLLTPNRRRPLGQPLSTLFVNVVKTESIDADKEHGETGEAHGDACAANIARGGLGCEDLADNDAGGVADAEGYAQGGGALVVPGEVAVEPDDGEASLLQLA